MKIVKVLETELKTSLSDTGTSLVLKAFVDSRGEEVILGDIGTYFYILVKQGSKIEIIKCNAITQNADGSATLTVATNGRDILPKSPYTGGSTGKSFQTGASVIFTNDPATMSEFAQLGEDNTFSGANTFTQFPSKSGSLTPTDDEHFVTLAHLNSVVLGDATVSALKSTVTFGENVSNGNPVYFKVSDGKWWRAYANNAATCINVKLAIADEDALADEEGAVVRLGRKGGYSSLTLGKQYLTDAGGIDETAGSYIVELGNAISATVIDFDPKDGDREQFLSTITGMIVPFAGDSVPSGFLACDGQVVSYTSYPDLWFVIQSKYGLGTGQAFTVTAANDTIDIVSHGYSNGQIFILSSTGTLPAGLSANTIYYVVNSTTNTFKLSLTAGGAAVDITDAGTGTHTLHTQFKVPDLTMAVPIGKGERNYGTYTIASTDINTATAAFTNTNGSNDYVTLSNGASLKVGDQVTFSNSIGAITANTIYYAIPYSGNNVRLATSYANAVAGTYITGFSTTSFSYTYNRPAVFTVASMGVELTDGDKVVLTTSGTLPTNIPAGTYYAIKITATTIELASSYANAVARRGGLIGSSNNAGSGSGNSTVKMYDPAITVGQTGGSPVHKLTTNELPSHQHGIRGTSGGDTNAIEITTTNSNQTYDSSQDTPDLISSVGGDLPHNNMQPYVVVSYIIKT